MTQTIIIDSDNYAASNVETMVFPGGEAHVKIPELSGEVLLYLKLRNRLDLLDAMLVIDAIAHRQEVTFLKIFIPYFPAARQDLIKDGRAPLTISKTAEMLTPSAYTVVPFRHFVFDIHSERTNRFVWGGIDNLMPSDLAINVRQDVVGIIAPDKGAAARAENYRAAFYPNAELIQCEKSRDPTTGDLSSSYTMPALTQTGHYIIVDDICDGGYTFNLLAEAFKRDPLSYGSTLELFVSHGIFSKGLGALDMKISHITTTDSWCRLPSSNRLTVLPLAPLLDRIINKGK
jgi:ribose-phosphate pyrophosphokinase